LKMEMAVAGKGRGKRGEDMVSGMGEEWAERVGEKKDGRGVRVWTGWQEGWKRRTQPDDAQMMEDGCGRQKAMSLESIFRQVSEGVE
jgi:hypothetical protein